MAFILPLILHETLLDAIMPALNPLQRTIKERSKGPLIAAFAGMRVIAVRDGSPGPEAWVVLRRNHAAYVSPRKRRFTQLGQLNKVSVQYYKLQEYAGLAPRKRSTGKATWPGRKQVYRRLDTDGRMAGDTRDR
jgi:hypothetical protein